MGKTVYIMRGLPGTGKSTKAARIIEQNGGGIICSADHFFESNGCYTFDHSKIGTAHQQCKNKFNNAILNGHKTIIVDNTNTTRKEYKYYVKTAENAGYEVEFVYSDSHIAMMIEDYVDNKDNIKDIDPGLENDILDQLEKTTHRYGNFERIIPRETLRAMLNRFELV